MRLSDFIRENTEKIMREWEAFARESIEPARPMNTAVLRDHIRWILQSTADYVKAAETKGEESANVTAAEVHGVLRWETGFDIVHMVSEYRLLRAVVIKLWTSANGNKLELSDIINFNDALDQELSNSLASYTARLNYSRSLFLGIIGHDLRTPLNAIKMSAQLMLRMHNLEPQQAKFVAQIDHSATRLSEMVSDLMDLTRTQLGQRIPLTKTHVDIGFIAKRAVEEICAISHNTIIFEASGNLEGEWDGNRISQVLSNLIGNAAQYASEGTPINVKLEGQPQEIVLTVHNQGDPIPSEKMAVIFDPLVRAYDDEKDENAESENLGLGLYIVREIVTAHDGRIDVASSEKEGTTFTIRLPRTASEPI